MIGGDQKRPCKFFMQGNCKFGTNCRDSHDVGSGGGGNNFGGGGGNNFGGGGGNNFGGGRGNFNSGGGGGGRGMGRGGYNSGGGGYNSGGGGMGGGGMGGGGMGGGGMGGGGMGGGGMGGGGFNSGGGNFNSGGGGGGRGMGRGGYNSGGGGYNSGGGGGYNSGGGGMNSGGFSSGGGMSSGGFNPGGGGGFGKPKTICDAFRGDKCKYGEACKFLHEYSPNMDLNLLQKLPLTEKKEGACALYVVEFPILAVAFARTVMFFSASDPQKNTNLQVDGEISCMIVEQKLLAVAYINQNKKAQVLLAPVQEGFQAKVLIPDCHDNSIHGMIFLEGKLITASKDCYLRMWAEDLQQQKMVSVASGMSTSAICSMKLIEVSGKPVIATGCEDGSIQLFVWEDKSVPPKWNRAFTIPEHNSQMVTSMALCNGLLYSGGLDGTVCITSTADTNPKRVNSVNLQAAISVLKYFQKADFIIVGFLDGTVHLYKSDGFTQHTWFKVHFGTIVSILCFEDLGLFMVLDYNGVVSCWQYLDAEGIKKKMAGSEMIMQ